MTLRARLLAAAATAMLVAALPAVVGFGNQPSAGGIDLGFAAPLALVGPSLRP